MQINRNFDNLVPNYLFAEVASRTNKYMQEHPDKKVIKLGIGDVTLPLAPVVIEAMKKGAEEQFLMMLHIRNCWFVEKGWIRDLM